MKYIVVMLASVLSGIQIGRILKYYTPLPRWLLPWLAGLSTFLISMGLFFL